jgi:hypothetical protein
MLTPQFTPWFAAAAIAGGFVQALPESRASVIYSAVDSLYTQNFDTLPIAPENVSLGTTANAAGWTDDNAAPAAIQFSIPGWYLYHPIDLSAGEGGVNGHQRFRIGNGSGNTGAFMSFGISGTTDRALGNVGSTTTGANGTDIYIGLRLTNSTGQILDSLTISYDGEQWRDGGAATPVAQGVTFGWSTTAVSISDPPALFTPVNELGFMSPVFTAATGTPVDGNNAGRVDLAPFTITGVNWAPGADLWLRWTDISIPETTMAWQSTSSRFLHPLFLNRPASRCWQRVFCRSSGVVG